MRFYPAVCAAVLLMWGQAVSAAEITVSAAASLSNAFKEIAGQYEKQYPQAKIRLNTAGSGALLQQALKGAPVDVLAFADETTMDRAQQQGLIRPESRRVFARNSLVVAAPAGSRLRVGSLADLNTPAFKRIALSNPASVPVGRYSKAVLERAGLWEKLQPKIIQTQHVRQSLDYVARGEVDAGFVYRTDAALMRDKVKVLASVPTATPVSYPLAVVTQSRQPAEAQRFARYVRTPAAQAVLKKYGFEAY
ncbi:molybdate ABC transporter substrate-binding protein [Uruburuella testudinis]|uniref:Molybdate ABC transporter substrate-binding protein n=1 Tax=Uruburuella testudinis TaxID=1282863 RepID=A0ABY4DWG0_9NEIS|nr:molybdate ABC transporter substrate-binding protein [Uruburuella testudinis]UOO82972.1 molybdate ABC transporter substrate-binding protein [Uruburuella testudinis]